MKTNFLTAKTRKKILQYFFLIITLAFFLFPFYWIVMTSIQPKDQLYAPTPNFIPKDITLENYVNILGAGRVNIAIALKNSLIVAVSVTVLCILFGIFAAYAFARLKFRGSNTLFFALIFAEMLPPVALLIPFYLIFKQLGLTNTLQGLVIMQTSWLLPIVTWILYSYFKTIPKDLEDSARIDGASKIGALIRIIVPLSLPGLVSAGVICFVFSMGEFMGAMAIVNVTRLHTLPLALAQFVTKYSIEYGKITASAVLTIIFPVAFVLIFQKFVVKGLTAGAVKE
ncbi:sugar ABC transporter permease [candidate division KSB3 bacterium]|uniref:Sugar ABC transporter permease n=1 Tax=candidate division KSB3 bacterium TaxID=2044937 RepID=A0A2G6KJS1_9BACT|nr:MAG: sugar ABC transporter permease [candidate division KSB3 bacterium]